MSVNSLLRSAIDLLVFIRSTRIFMQYLFLALPLIFFHGFVLGQQNVPQIDIQVESMTIDELKKIYAEIVREHPTGQCLAWLAFDKENIATPIAIYDAVYGGAMMKVNSGLVFSVTGAPLNSTIRSFGFLQELAYVSKFYYKNREFLSKNEYFFALNTDHLKTVAKKKKCTFANAKCRKYSGEFSLSVSSLNEGKYKLLTEIPIGLLMIEDMCPVARGSGSRYSPVRELSGLVEQSNLGRMSEKDYLNDLAANGIRQSWLKPNTTMQEALK